MKLFIPTRRHRRGAALVLIMILAIFLAGIMAVLSTTVGYGYQGANERRDMQESLASSDDVSERLAYDMQYSDSADPVDSLLTYEDLVDSSGATVAGNRDWYGYFEAVAADESLDTIQLYYDASGGSVATVGAATWSARLSSAYRTWRNDDVDLVLNDALSPTSPLPFPRVLNADRISLVKPLYDYYVASIDNAPGIANNPAAGLNLRQAQIVLRAEKPYYPSALYLDGGELTITEGVVDGRDHQDVALEESYFVVPFSSKIKIGDLPAGSAGYHHSLHYTDPLSGEEETLFNDSHTVWSNPSSVEGNYLVDSGGNEIEFSKDSPLDFYIHTWQGNDTTHHLFGNHIFAPGNTHHGKRYGYAWNEILHIKSSAIANATKRAELGQAIYNWLKESNQVSKYGGDLTALISNATAFKADPLNGSDKIQTYGVDNDGDGTVEVDHDVDDNGELNRWTSGDSPLAGYDKAGIIEDRNNNGVRDDDDRRLANAMHDYFYELQNDADTSNDSIQKLELVMGFEDLDVEVGENPDWDFNDVFLILDLDPHGNSNFDEPDPPSFTRVPGIDAVISGEPGATYSSTVTTSDSTMVRTAYGYESDGVTLSDVYGNNAYVAKETSYIALMNAFLAAPSVTNVGAGGDISSLVGTSDTTDGRDPAVVHVQNSGGATAVLDGSVQGEGVLIVEGDLLITDHVVWRGSIIVRGNLTLDGDVGRGVWVFGSVMVSGDVTVEGNSNICYSSQALEATRDLQPQLRPVLKRVAYRRPL